MRVAVLALVFVHVLGPHLEVVVGVVDAIVRDDRVTCRRKSASAPSSHSLIKRAQVVWAQNATTAARR